MTQGIGTVAALVPMRHGSERIPGKNHRDFAGKPLCAWIFESLLASETVNEILVNTDSPPIQEIVQRYRESQSKPIRVVDRPPELTGGHVSMNDVIRHDLDLVEADVVLQTHATNPLLRVSTIDAAVRAYQEHLDHFDSVFSVTRHQARCYDAHGVPLNHQSHELRRTQDLDPVYEENSCLYVFSRNSFMATGARIGMCPLLLELDAVEAVDLDEPRDLLLAEALARSGVVDSAEKPRIVELREGLGRAVPTKESVA